MARLTAEKVVLGIILLIYLILGILFATQTPAWQAPDEPAHYNYIAQVASDGCCPVIEPGDWNQTYLSELTSERFHPTLLDDLDTIQYEDHQPPLYYLLASVIWKLTNGGLIALRLFSVLLGAIVVFSAYEIGKTILPDRPEIALGAAAFVAFLPQHVAMLSAVNNDALAEVIIARTLLETLRYLKGANVPLWRLGLWIGAGFLTKTTTFFLAGIVPLAIVLRWWTRRDTDSKPNTVTLAKALAWCLIPALLLGGIWWARNLGTYGMPDFLGLRAHDVVVADQPRTADGIELMGFNAYLSQGITTTFNSFWGQFGWMGLPMEGRIYTVLKLFTAVIVIGLLIDIFYLRRTSSESLTSVQRNLWLIMGLTVLFGFIAYIYYNTEFQQFQGRYLFPALIPLGLWAAIGVDAWRRLSLRLLPETLPLRQLILHPYAIVIVMFALAALDAYLILRVIPPALLY